MARIGFIGAGLMGHGMVSRLMGAGHELTVIAHRNRKPIEDLVTKGAREAGSLTALAEGQDVIYVCVTGTPQVEEALGKISPALKPGQLIIDTSTARPESTERLAAGFAARGIGWAEAPVTGMPLHAAKGELVSMVGATPADFERAKVFLAATSKAIHHMGPPGAGHRAKLLNNLVSVGQSALILQAYRMAAANNIDWATMYAIMCAGIARSGSLERIMDGALKGDFKAYVFSAANAAKDFGYIADFARASCEDAATFEAIRALYASEAEAHGPDFLISEMLDPANTNRGKTAT